ncbi:hypothetical protein ABZ234_03500 [Nocardiopsis sp. NPDC006198]|uniref:hypothetical protein n=1 Tax=Nocardiopsis sp. NPDC006198 TaxID=3154472 RepID=UPI0033A8F6CE
MDEAPHELLQRAANKARGTAQDAIEKNQGWMVEEKSAPLHFDDSADLYSHDLRWAVVRDLYPHHEVAMDLTKAHADHVALWHPAVALVVADWLDTEARNARLIQASVLPRHAEAVARALLAV